VYLDSGRLAAWGLPNELLGHKSLYAISQATSGDHPAVPRDED
jgi:hypothetical protein